MANKRLLLRRGTTAENDAFTGADGEITYDTEGKNLRLHDGNNPGGTTLTAGAQAVGGANAIQTSDGSGNLTDSGVNIADAVISSTSSTFAIGTSSSRADGFFDVVDIDGATLSVVAGNLQLDGEDILTSSDLVVSATSLAEGKVQLSKTAEASAGADNSTAMTPKLVRQEIDSRVNVALTSAVQYKGTFTSSTEWDSNGPDGSGDYFADAAINEGDLWYFSGTVATDVLGVTFNTGDHLIWSESITAGSLIDSTKFDKIDNTDSVSSVNGDVGAVEVDIESALEIDSNVLAAHTLTFSNSSSALVINKVQSNQDADLLLSADGTGDVTLVGDGTNVGSLKFKCENTASAHNVTIKSPDHAAFSAGSSYDLTLPAVAPTDGQVLTSTASGTLSWGATSLQALTDTNISGATLGQVLQYDGSEWKNADLNVSSDSFAYENILSTATPTAFTLSTDGKKQKAYQLGKVATYTLEYPGPTTQGGVLVIKNNTASSLSLEDPTSPSQGYFKLLNTIATGNSSHVSIKSGQVMSFVSSGTGYWIQTYSEENDLVSLNDVGISSAQNGQVLTYNNGIWENEDVPGGMPYSLVSIGGGAQPSSPITISTPSFIEYRFTGFGPTTFTMPSGANISGSAGSLVYFSIQHASASPSTVAGTSSGTLDFRIGDKLLLVSTGSAWDVLSFERGTEFENLNNAPSSGTTSVKTNTEGMTVTQVGSSTARTHVDGDGLVIPITIPTSALDGLVNFIHNPSSSNGQIRVGSERIGKNQTACFIQNNYGWEKVFNTTKKLVDIEDVRTTATTNGHVLTWNNVDKFWEPQAPAGGGGGSLPTVFTTGTGANQVPDQNSYTLQAKTGIEEIYTLNPTVANQTLTLQSAATVGAGYKYNIKNLSTNTLTIDPDGTEYIDTASQTTFLLNTQYSSITLVSDGSNWYII